MPYFSDEDFPSLADMRQTSFQLSISLNDIDGLRKLFEQGVDINANCAEYTDGNTLVLAAEAGSTDAVIFLLQNGVERATAAVRAAAVGGHEEIVEILLEAGINPDADAIVSVAGTDNVKILERLIQVGAPINFPSSHGQFFALHNAVLANYIRVVEILLKAGANPNVVTEGGRTPLMMAAYGCDADIARLLLSYGADASIVNEDGETAIDMAIESGSDSHVEIFSRCKFK